MSAAEHAADERVLADGTRVPIVWVERYGATLPWNPIREEWVTTSPPGEKGRGQFHICGCCGCRPCHNACPLQEMPDLLRYKASRAGLTEDAWLTRYAAEHGHSFFAAYPEHPETIARSPERSVHLLHPAHTP